jgi:hypothetical protein
MLETEVNKDCLGKMELKGSEGRRERRVNEDCLGKMELKGSEGRREIKECLERMEKTSCRL